MGNLSFQDCRFIWSFLKWLLLPSAPPHACTWNQQTAKQFRFLKYFMDIRNPKSNYFLWHMCDLEVPAFKNPVRSGYFRIHSPLSLSANSSPRCISFITIPTTSFFLPLPSFYSSHTCKYNTIKIFVGISCSHHRPGPAHSKNNQHVFLLYMGCSILNVFHRFFLKEVTDWGGEQRKGKQLRWFIRGCRNKLWSCSHKGGCNDYSEAANLMVD